MQTANKIYNIGSINTAKFVYEEYKFDKATIYNIEHIESAQFLFKSADYQDLEQKIINLKDLISLSVTIPEKKSSYEVQLQEAEIQKLNFISDVKDLYVTLSSLRIDESNHQVVVIKELFEEGKFREANILLSQVELKKEKDILLLSLEQAKDELESGAEKFVLKARLVLTDLSNENRVTEAMECYEEAIDNSKKIDSPNTFIRLHDFGHFLLAHSFVTRAIDVLGDAIVSLPITEDKAHYSKSYEAAIYCILGSLNVLVSEYELAQVYFDESIRIYRELTEAAPELYVHDLITVYNCRGTFKWRSGKLQEAFQDFQNCDFIFKQLPEDEKEQSIPNLAFVKNNTGNIYSSIGYNEEAELSYTEAHHLLEQLDHRYPGRFRGKLALSYCNMAWAQTLLAKYDESYNNYKKSISVYRELIEKEGYVHYSDLASALCNLGVLLHKMGLYEKAIKVFGEAKELDIKMAEIEPDVHLPSLATVLEYEGEMLFEMKEYDKALVNFTSALKIREDQVSIGAHFYTFVADAENWIEKIKAAALIK